MKITSIIYFFIFFNFISYSQDFQWSGQTGSSGLDFPEKVVVDEDGNVYYSGLFKETVDFDFGVGVENLTSEGGSDIFVLKMDAGGNFLWVKQFGGSSTEYNPTLGVDLSGNLYLSGGFRNTVDFDPGPDSFDITSTGGIDLFVLKLDNQGDLLWAHGIGGGFGGSNTQVASATEVDVSGNVYVFGEFFNTVDFDPGTGVSNLTSNSSGGSRDLFALKLDTDGNFMWVNHIGGDQSQFAETIHLDGVGNVFVTGSFYGEVDFDSGVGVFNLTSNGSGDCFLLKIDEVGNFVWAIQIGGNGNDGGRGISTDFNGDVFFIGGFYGTVDFDPGVNTYILNNVDGQDGFILKLNTNGEFQWVESLGDLNSLFINGIDIDAAGNLNIVGSFSGSFDFDPGPDVESYTAISYDAFLYRLDSNGDYLEVQILVGDSNVNSKGITLDGGNVYMYGGFYGTVDFNPGIGMSNGSSIGSADVYIVKLGMGDDCPTIVLSSPMDDYGALDIIYQQAISISATNFIGTGSEVNFDVSSFVELLSGFEIEAGSEFITTLNGCN